MGDNEEAVLVCPKGMRIKREELVKVLVQALNALGHGQSAEYLMAESGFYYEPERFESLKTQYINGEWEQCAVTLCKIHGLDIKTMSKAMQKILQMWLVQGGLKFAEGFDLSQFLNGKYGSRLVEADKDELRKFITGPITCAIIQDPIIALDVRKRVWKTLENALPPRVQMSDGRLLALIEHGVSAQINSCLTHNTERWISLYRDHSCGEDTLPTKTIKILRSHYDGVFDIKFSHNGQYLASAASDNTAILWEVPATGWDLRIKHVLRGHETFVYRVSWSPNDEWLLTGGYAGLLKIWNVQTGECTYTLSEEEQVLGSCALLSDQLDIAYVTYRQPRSVHVVRIGHDHQDAQYTMTEGIEDFAIAPDRTKLVFICPDIIIGGDAENPKGKAIILNTHTGDKEIITEESAITAASISEDGKNLILNLFNSEIHVWNLSRIKIRPLIYRNHNQFEPTQSCIGGVESAFLVSGTDYSKVRIWNRRNEDMAAVAVMSGHSGGVGSVSWNPRRPEMLASASDDTTIRIWGPGDIPEGADEE